MAYAVKRSSVSGEIANSIRMMLCLQPEAQNNKYNRGNLPQPILFYKLEDDILDLPFLFAASLFQITPNLDISYPITKLEFTGTLREKQVEVEKESWEQLEKYGTTTLGLHPGFGKTILGANLSCKAKLMTCILVHREILTTQWKKTFEDVTNAKVWIVGEKHPPPICDVIICMDTRWNTIPKYMRDAIGFLIIDEAHAFCTPSHLGCLLAFHPKYIVIESASLLRDDGMHTMIYAMAGVHGVFRDINKPFSVMKIITNTKPERKINKQGGVDWHTLVSSTLLNPRRQDIILNLITSNLDRKILVLTSLVEHAQIIHDGLCEKKIKCDYLCGNKKTYQDATVLTGTISKIGTGFDQANFCATYSGDPFNLLILVCSLKKYSMLVQNVGRAFRSDFPTVMHLVDDDDIYRNHWVKAKKWYQMHGGIITEHNIINKEQPITISQNITAVQNSWAKAKAKEFALKQLETKHIPVDMSKSNLK